MADRQQTILNATLDLVSEHGLLKTTMSQIAKRSKSSPGIIYHYYKNKDEIMDTLFNQLLSEMTQYTFGYIDMERSVGSRYQETWLRKYHFHRENPQKTSFIEQYKNSAYYTQKQAQLLNNLNRPLLQMGMVDIEQGSVINLPLEVIYVMTLGVALTLAKEDIQMQRVRDDNELTLIAERVCKGVLL